MHPEIIFRNKRGKEIPLTPFKRKKIRSILDMQKYLLYSLIILLGSCGTVTKVDMIIHNAAIYTVDSSFRSVEAMAVRGGRIVATGTSEKLLKQFNAKEKLDAQGKFIYPGFIDAHAHFFGYGHGLQTVDLTATESWEECIERIINFITKDSITQSRYAHKGTWIIGRGWDQNDWKEKEFPDKEALDKLFKDNPVLLTRIDGHAAIARCMKRN
jgi:predicted amidohydrolase YtcJ